MSPEDTTPRPTHEGRKASVTSVDVAAEAGVSQATVARAYSSPDMVSEATRQRVHEAAERIGYVPNAIARSLKSDRTNIVGFVVPAHGEYWQSVLTELSRQVVDHSRQLLLFSFAETDDLNKVLDSVHQYRLDALLLASANIGHTQLVRMARTDIPVVAFNQPAADDIVHSVSVDNTAGMSQIAQHLINVGVRDVLFVGGISDASTDQLRYQGAARTFGAAGIACPYVEAGAFSYEAGYKVGTRIASDDQELPDAVVVASDEVAFGVIDGLRTAGVTVPNDVLVTGFDGLPQAAWAGYDLTTLVQPTSVLVRQAVDLVLGDRHESLGAGEVVTRVVEGDLRVGSSTDAARLGPHSQSDSLPLNPDTTSEDT